MRDRTHSHNRALNCKFGGGQSLSFESLDGACLPRLQAPSLCGNLLFGRWVLLALFFVFLAGPAFAYQGTFPKEGRATLLSYFPTADLNQTKWALGDLDGDGLDDLVILVFYPKYNEELRQSIMMERLLILHRTKERFQLVAQSLDWEDHDRRHDDISITGGVLTLLMEGAASCCAHYSHELKFKWRANTFLLIGEEQVEAGRDARDKQYSSRKSINYLSKQISESGRKLNKRFSDEALSLEKFSYDNYQRQFKSAELKN